jgi:hypothetical protein
LKDANQSKKFIHLRAYFYSPPFSSQFNLASLSFRDNGVPENHPLWRIKFLAELGQFMKHHAVFIVKAKKFAKNGIMGVLWRV